MKKFITCLLIIYAIFFVTACPPADQVRTAAKWGYDTSERTRTAQDIVIQLYRKQLVSLADKDRFFDAAAGAFDVLEIYNNAVEHQKQLIDAKTQTVDGALAVLHDVLSNQALDKINAMIVALNLMNPVKAGELFNWIKTIAAATLKVLDIVHIPRASLVAVKS